MTQKENIIVKNMNSEKGNAERKKTDKLTAKDKEKKQKIDEMGRQTMSFIIKASLTHHKDWGEPTEGTERRATKRDGKERGNGGIRGELGWKEWKDQEKGMTRVT